MTYIEHQTADAALVVVVNPGKEGVQCAAGFPRLDAVDASKLVRPCHEVVVHAPLEAANVRQALCFGEPRLASSEPVERVAAIGHVDRSAHASDDCP